MKDTGYNTAVSHLAAKLRRRLITGSYQCAIETLILLRSVISNVRYNSLAQLLSMIKEIGHRLTSAQPIELAIGNVVRRVLHLVREEAMILARQGDSMGENIGDVSQVHHHHHHHLLPHTQVRLGKLLDDDQHLMDETMLEFWSKGNVVASLKPVIIQVINELMDELESVYANISAQAIEHIHNNEIIMTTGKSKTVEEFLKAARRKRKFQVIVAEDAPTFSGQQMAKSLALHGIETTLVTDASIYAVMSRVNKVILGTHAILANGGLIAGSGSHMMAAAAKYHHIPVVVLSGLYKLSVLQPFDEDMFNLCVGPSSVLKFEEEIMSQTDVVNPFFDYIAPENIALFVTNQGGHPPSYIYRLLSENYDPRDYRLVSPKTDTSAHVGDQAAVSGQESVTSSAASSPKRE